MATRAGLRRGAQHALGLAVTPQGDVLLAGTMSGAMSFGGPMLTSAGGFDVYVAKLGAGGCHVYSRAIGNPQFEGPNAVASSPLGDAVLTGSFGGSLDFGLGALAANGDDAFLAKLAP